MIAFFISRRYLFEYNSYEAKGKIMQSLFIIHSFNGGTKKSFGPYLVKECTSLGLNVIFPDFPTGENANYYEWSKILDQYLLKGILNSDSIIIAHSLGAHFIPKYIAERKIKIKAYISCAGFINKTHKKNTFDKVMDDFVPTESQLEKDILLMKYRYAIYSDNDPISSLKELEYYADKLNAEKIFIPNVGHLGPKSGLKELPEALEIIKKHKLKGKDFNMKELWEYKLDLLFYGIGISQKCYELLQKNKEGKVNNEDYITTKGLFIILNDCVYVNARINPDSPYFIDFLEEKYILKYQEEKICTIQMKQAPSFALQAITLPNGKLITDLVNIHGDRIRIQPIQGCANRCRFCDLNRLKYDLQSIKDLEDAFLYCLNKENFRHVLISGGSPYNHPEDFDYLNHVYQYFGEKYGKTFPIDIMLVPRGLHIDDSSDEAYEEFLKALKNWNISGLSINLELYNDSYRKKYIPQKDMLGKENYFRFIKMAVNIFGKGNVRSCIIIGLEEIEDSLKAVEQLSSIGCMPVLSPYIPNDEETFLPSPEFMKEVLIRAKEITDSYNVELGPICNPCKHNTIHFQ